MRQPYGGIWLHYYSKEFKYSPYIHVFLAALSLIIFYGLSFIPFLDSLKLSVFKTFTIFAFLEIIFDLFVWKLFCKLKWIPVLDYSGTYKGTMRSVSKDGEEKEHSVDMNIKQTWSKMKITFRSEKVSSISFSASIIVSEFENDNPHLWYNYFTDGKNNGKKRISAHYGTSKLEFSKDKSSVSATYFTEQSRDSSGAFTLHKV